MKNLLKKEFRLALHPAAVIFLFLATMLLIPNYPLSVTFFYSCLGVFFISLNARENRDVVFTALLPVKKAQLVSARIAMVVILQLGQIVLCVPCMLLRSLYPMGGNEVGMDANLALLGFGLFMMGLFNLLFFPKYYKNPAKVGSPFVLGCTGVFLMVFVIEALPRFVPLFRDKLDTPLFRFVTEKAVCFAVCAAAYAVMTLAACRVSQRRFETLDLNG